MTRNLLALIGLLTIIFGAGFAAYANGDMFPDDKPKTMAVSYDGLDLSSSEGRKMLEVRIKRSINMVCGRVVDSNLLREQARIRQCRRDAWAGTQPQMVRAVEVAMRRRHAADLADTGSQGQPLATN